MTIAEAIGWVAAALTLATFSMKTMVWLRAVAIGANLAFIGFGFLSDQPPILILHLVLLPLNSVRLLNALETRRQLQKMETSAFDVSWIRDVAVRRTFKSGELIFAQGDEPDNVYFIVSGKVLVVGPGVTLGASELFGEVAFLTQHGRRTSDVRALADTSVLALDRDAFRDLIRGNPEFAAHVCRLVADRLAPNQHPQATVSKRKRRRAKGRRAA